MGKKESVLLVDLKYGYNFLHDISYYTHIIVLSLLIWYRVTLLTSSNILNYIIIKNEYKFML